MLKAVTDLHRLLGLLYSSILAGNWNLSLSRSASSVGERQSETFCVPLLPKRAETFGGFDHSVATQNSKDKGMRETKSVPHFKRNIFIYRCFFPLALFSSPTLMFVCMYNTRILIFFSVFDRLQEEIDW